jgi:hypothetical protein
MGLVHVSKFFKIKMMPNKVAKYVSNLEKELEELKERYEIVGKTRKKQIEERRVEIRKAIAQLNHQVGRSVQKKKAK